MADVILGAYTHPQEIVAEVGAATSAPVTADDGVRTGDASTARLFMTYGGTVTAATFTIHYWDGDAWYVGEEITGTPASGNSVHTVEVGTRSRFFVQVATLTGTNPTVAIKAAGI